MSGTVPIQTPRLTLRPHVPEDAAILHRDFGADESLSRYSGWNPYATPEQARETVRAFIGRYADPRFYGWAIQREGRLIGTLGAYDYDPVKNQIEAGFSIARAHRGRGYAAEALAAALRYLTGPEGIARVTAWCAAENAASRRTLEKAGMVLCHTEKGGLEVAGRRYDRLDYVFGGAAP